MSESSKIYVIAEYDHDWFVIYGYYTDREAAERELAEITPLVVEEQLLSAELGWYRHLYQHDIPFETYMQGYIDNIETGRGQPKIYEYEMNTRLAEVGKDIQYYKDKIENEKTRYFDAKGTPRTVYVPQSEK